MPDSYTRCHLTAMLRRAVLLTVVVLLPVSAALGSDFEGQDGNLISDGASDWESFLEAPGLRIGPDQPSGKTDDSIQGKEDDPAPAVVLGSIPKNKSDLQRFYVVHERMLVGGAEKDYLYVAWVRSNILGTANNDFEFNQSGALSANGVMPERTAGDMLITFGFASGGNQVNLGLSRWTETGPCEAAAAPPCWGPVEPLSGFAEGRVNDVPVYDPIAGESLSELTFGEAKIDLTEAGVFDADACVSFGSAYVKSRSSDSFTASLKDFIHPIDVSVTNCASVTIVKNAVPDDEQAFRFTGSPELIPDDLLLQDDGDEGDGRPSRATLMDRLDGTYRVAEEPEPGWDLTGVSCTAGGVPQTDGDGRPSGAVDVTLSGTDQVECIYTNTKRGRILVDVVTDPAGDPHTFAYALNGGPEEVSQAFSLIDTAPLHEIGALRPGLYSVTQSDPGAEWDLTGVSCSDGSPADAVQLDPGETVTCTFTNTKRGMILVGVVTEPSGDPQVFDLTLTGGPSGLGQSFQLADGQPPHASGHVLPGDGYAAAQTLPEAWFQQEATCDDGSSAGNIGVSPGEIVTCTFTNYRKGRILVDKRTDPGRDAASFDFSLTGGPSAIDQQFGLSDEAVPHDSGLLMPGEGYLVQELLAQNSGSSDWDLTLIDCRSARSASSFAFQGTDPDPGFQAGDDTAEIHLGVGDEVTCTFTNTKRASITVVKEAVPEGTRDFGFSLSGPEVLEEFQLDDDGDETDDAGKGRLPSRRTFARLRPGPYTVAEDDAGTRWDLGDILCSDSGGDTVSEGYLETRSASFALRPGEEVTCRFTNIERGRIHVDKTVVDQAAECPGGFDPRQELFEFSSDYAGTFFLSHGQSHHSEDLPADMSYQVSENRPSGWEVTNSCTYPDGSLGTGGAGAWISLPPGGEVSCTFTNALRLHTGSSGFWRNWDNHYTYADFAWILSDALEPWPVYSSLFDAGTGALRDGASDAIDDIYDFSSGSTESDQKAMAELTTATLNLGVSTSEIDAIRAFQKNDGVSLDCLVDLSSIAGADEIVEQWAGSLMLGGKTVGHLFEVAQATFTGDVWARDWSFDRLTEQEQWILAAMLEGVNIGSVLSADPCSYPDERTCLSLAGLPEATEGRFYSTFVEVEGGVPPYTWTIAAGELPEGLLLNASTGEIWGTPVEVGTFSFSIQVSDSDDPARITTREYRLTINPHPTVVGLALPDCTMGVYYYEPLAVTGGTAPLTLAIIAGELPEGLTLDTQTGVISGTPVETKPPKSKTYVFWVEAVDANGAVDAEELSLTLHPSGTESCDGSELAPAGTPTLTVERSADHALLSWTAVADATAYDVVRGDPSSLRGTGGDFGAAVQGCVADDRTTTSLAVPDMPSPGRMFFFLVRGVNCGGAGTYDSGTSGQTGFRDTGIAASGSGCP